MHYTTYLIEVLLSPLFLQNPYPRAVLDDPDLHNPFFLKRKA
jgi:hypothetical protein